MMTHPTIDSLIYLDGHLYERVPVYSDDNGYLMARIKRGSGSTRSLERIHRLLWEMAHGTEVPSGMLVRHLDDVKSNNAPGNLALGTHLDNMTDRVANGNGQDGERNATAKLTEIQVREIKRRRAVGESLRSLATEFGISIQRVCDLSKGRGWKHLN
jgi:hypothetical protein